MKNLFNDISQDEKNRILEMHSAKKNVISEQYTLPTNTGVPELSTTRQNPVPRPRPNKPSGAVNVPQPKKVTENMTVNLYPDFSQSQQPKKHTIVKIIDKDNSVELQLDKDAEMSLTTDKLIFKCGSKEFTIVNNVMDKDSTVYNRELLKSLENQFCTSSKPGLSVPKADFAMNNQSTDTTTGIA